MNPAPPVTSTRTAADATVAARWRRGCCGSPRASDRAAPSASSSRWRGRATRRVSNRRWPTSCPGRITSPASWRRRASTTVCLSTRRRDPRWPLRLRRLVADGGFDVVHSHSPVPAVAARLAARTVPADRRPALVTTEHNTWTSLPTGDALGEPADERRRRGDVRRDRGGAGQPARRGRRARRGARARHRRRAHRRPAGRRAGGGPGRARAEPRRARDRHASPTCAPRRTTRRCSRPPACSSIAASRSAWSPSARAHWSARSRAAATSSDSATTSCSPGSARTPSPSWRRATSSCWRRRGRACRWR